MSEPRTNDQVARVPDSDGPGGYPPPVDEVLTGLERELCRIPEVRATRIVANDRGVPVEVHVLAAPGKHAKQLVRDVQSVAMASAGIEIDHRIVSVVQLDDGTGSTPGAAGDPDTAHGAAPNGTATHPAPADMERIRVEQVTAVRAAGGYEAMVTLVRGEDTATGTASGPAAGSLALRLAAQATLAALRELEPAAARVEVDAAHLTRIGERDVALTTLVLVNPPNEEVVVGSAVVRPAGDHEAVARSVLDALNRRLVRIT